MGRQAREALGDYNLPMSIRGVTFDFFCTLVHHRDDVGRGRRFTDYLRACGLSSAPWEHEFLYSAFDLPTDRLRSAQSEAEQRRIWIEVTRRLFQRADVVGPHPVDPVDHVAEMRQLLGPRAFVVYPDVLPVLRALRARELRLAVVSDWQKGLRLFCDELGLGPFFEAVVASAEVGFAKPDRRLFDHAARRLGLDGAEILHVGDHELDVEGARSAGFQALRLQRDVPTPGGDGSIHSLADLLERL